MSELTIEQQKQRLVNEAETTDDLDRLQTIGDALNELSAGKEARYVFGKIKELQRKYSEVNA